MRLLPKILLVLLSITVLPAALTAVLLTQRGNAVINGMLVKNAELELEFFAMECGNSAATLNSLGIEEFDFYRTNAQRSVIRYAERRRIEGGFLYVLDAENRPVHVPRPLDDRVIVIQKPFEEWDWVLGIAFYRSYLGEFRRDSVIGTAILSLVILVPVVAFGLLLSRLSVRPIRKLEAGAELIASGDLAARVDIRSSDELGQLGRAFNSMADNIERLTKNLEDRVRARTSELEDSLENLRTAQDQLLKRERLANLGGIVAGIAHEINTPVGVGITGSTHLKDLVHEARRQLDEDGAENPELRGLLDDIDQTSALVHMNLNRAGRIISEFKQLAVDQVSEQKRRFNIAEYVSSIIDSPLPTLRKTSLKIENAVDDNLSVISIPGVFYQILTNLIMNSMIHGYEAGEAGRITISGAKEGDDLVLRYRDDGKGVAPAVAERIYEPFVSTKSEAGGSGLGMNIVFNLVNQNLGGRIELETEPGAGVLFTMTIPLSELS